MTDNTDFTYPPFKSLNLPSDWKQFHAEQLAKISPCQREMAVEFLRGYFANSPLAIEQIRDAARKDSQTWWSEYHMTWGMAVRNLLRRNGFDEKTLGVDNLDNVYVGLVEESLL